MNYFNLCSPKILRKPKTDLEMLLAANDLIAKLRYYSM